VRRPSSYKDCRGNDDDDGGGGGGGGGEYVNKS
jgi:hypothetical protein